MTAIHGLIQENIRLLQQAAAVIEPMTDDCYLAEESPAVSSVAKHFRHIFNHFEAILSADGNAVDYETRQRGTEIETQRSAALDKIRNLIVQMEKLSTTASDTTPLSIERIIRNADGMIRTTQYPTSLARELDFVHQHTVHHYAMIALILRQYGVAVAPDFGMSPATLRFNASVTTHN
jgi:uncharacterized damage-inducible protein DinB